MKQRILDESGSSTLLVVGALAVMAILLVSSMRLAQVIAEQHRLAYVAEAMAIAVADVARGYRTGHACEVAHQLAGLTDVVLRDCKIIGFDGFVSVQSKKVKPALATSARAGS